MPRRALPALTIALLALLLAGCGGNDEKQSTASGPAAANEVNQSDFPTTDGKKTVADLQREVNAGQNAQALPAANDFVLGRENRFPFGIFDADRKPVWGPTMMYISSGTDAPAKGPFPVKAHDFDVPAEFQSETAKHDIQTIGNGYYSATLPASTGRTANLLFLTKVGDGFEASAAGLTLQKNDPVPAPGEKVPAIDTPTLDDVNGDASKIDTRVPADDMHDVSLKDALKQKKPIVLIFATPKLCASRVCAPNVDVAEAVHHELGDDVIFIHNEIYNDNDINKGYRSQVKDFGLPSEPFTFVIGRDGRVVEQLQGPFDQAELIAAIKKAQ